MTEQRFWNTGKTIHDKLTKSGKTITVTNEEDAKILCDILNFEYETRKRFEDKLEKINHFVWKEYFNRYENEEESE